MGNNGPMDTPEPSAVPATEPPSRVPAARDDFYARVGGRPTFAALVDAFYAGVADDPVLRPMYPEEDLGPAAERLTMFLEQYWGGSTAYSEQRGHPRLRMRHSRYRIDADARDRWIGHMMAAVDTLALAPTEDEQLRDYLTRAAYGMVNDLGPGQHPGLNLV